MGVLKETVKQIDQPEYEGQTFKVPSINVCMYDTERVALTWQQLISESQVIILWHFFGIL